MAKRTIEMEVKKQIGILQSLGYGKKTIARELGLLNNPEQTEPFIPEQTEPLF